MKNKEQRKSFKNLLKNNIVSVIVLILVISIAGVFAGNVFVTDGDLDVSDDLNVSGNLTTTGTGIFGDMMVGTSVPNYRFSIDSTDHSDQIGIYHDNNHAYLRTTDGIFIFKTDEGTNTITSLRVAGKGTGYGNLEVRDEDDAEYFGLYCAGGYGNFRVAGATPKGLIFQESADAPIFFFTGAASGETPEIKIYGYRAGDIQRELDIGVGIDAADTASFDGVSNYYFDGNMGIETFTPTYPLEVNSNVSGISIWAQDNISAAGFITRTSVFDKSRGSALDFIKDADYYLSNEEIDHKKFYGYAGEFKVTDYSKPVYSSFEETFCEEVGDETFCREETINQTDYPYKLIEEGVSLDAEIDVLRQAVYELSQELCKKDDSYSWC